MTAPPAPVASRRPRRLRVDVDPASIADAAADLITREGFRRGALWRLRLADVARTVPCGPYDLPGAVMAVGGRRQHVVVDALIRRCRGPLAAWSDVPGRTGGEAVALLRAVADDLRAAGPAVGGGSR